VARTGVQTPDMVWDPSFETWASFEVRFNSQMILMSSDLSTDTGLFYGFGRLDRERVLDSLATLG